MKLFKCNNCGQLLYFENSICECCKHSLGFIAEDLTLVTLVQDANNPFYRICGNDKPVLGRLFSGNKTQFKYCKNHEFNACNWLIPSNSPSAYCRACELNHIIPDLTNAEHNRQWHLIEIAKHRLIYTLLRLKLPLISKLQDQVNGLSFHFLTDENMVEKILTGHEDGLITLNVNEADDDKRELSRKQMNEPYRTLLGHFRHEVGHYYWDRLIMNSKYIESFRQLFGDEREDYSAALQRYYSQGAPADWNINFISAYSSSHPWEAWAETWAHYMHIMDTLETAESFGLKVGLLSSNKNTQAAETSKTDIFEQKNFKELIDRWLPLTFAVNSLNRSMGNHDLYPFVIFPNVVEKLSFIHKVVCESRVK